GGRAGGGRGRRQGRGGCSARGCRRRGAYAAGGGDRFAIPRAGRVRRAGRGVVLRPGSGHHRGAGPDVAAAGGRRPAGGVGGFGGGGGVAAAGGGAAADPGGGGGGRGGGRGGGPCGGSPGPGAAWGAGGGGWRRWPGRTPRRCGASWTPIRPGSHSPHAKPPWLGHPGQPGIGTAPRRSGISHRGDCCWWWTSSRSCSPSAPTRRRGGRSS